MTMESVEELWLPGRTIGRREAARADLPRFLWRACRGLVLSKSRWMTKASSAMVYAEEDSDRGRWPATRAQERGVEAREKAGVEGRGDSRDNGEMEPELYRIMS
jgi:hypothetical protein